MRSCSADSTKEAHLMMMRARRWARAPGEVRGLQKRDRQYPKYSASWLQYHAGAK